MKKRKPFFISGNFQLKFLLSYALILAAGIFFSVYFIYCSLKGILEKAAFSSHLSLSSTGELFWLTIVRINILIAMISVLAGFLAIALIHAYLDRFFHKLVAGLKAWGREDFSLRLKTKGSWWVQHLFDDFNRKAGALDKDNERFMGLVDSLIATINERRPGMLQKIKGLHAQLTNNKRP